MDPAYERLLARLRTPNKHPRLVLAPSHRRGAFDSHAVDCPFVFRHEGRFRMLFLGFDGIGYRTGIASSDDLVNWQNDGLYLDRGPPGSTTQFNVALMWIVRENDLFGEGTLRRVNGVYLGAYQTYPRPGYEAGPGAIGTCTSVDLHAWNLGPPCLFAEQGAEWEAGGLYKPCLVEDAGTYWLFYNAKNRQHPWAEQIGVAHSRDLRSWTRCEGNPVLPAGGRGAFDERFASEPCVLRIEDTWAMFYFGLSQDGHARDSVAFSRDLVSWEKSGEVLVDVGPEGSLDSRHAHKPSMFWHDGRLFHHYCAVAPNPAGIAGEVETGEIRGITFAVS